MDDWQFVNLLGSGGFANVTHYRNVVSGESLAIKECRYDERLMLDRKVKERWCQEIELLQTLHHDNLLHGLRLPPQLLKVLVGGHSLNASRSFIPMALEYCNSGDLRKMLNRGENVFGLSVWDTVCVMRDVMSALEYLHSKRITHRDIKPENILAHNLQLNKGGVEMVYKLSDMGYAKSLINDTNCHSFVGTLPYLAPEQFDVYSDPRAATADDPVGAAPAPYHHSVDYWALATVVFECATGRRPHGDFQSCYETIKFLKSSSKRDDHICSYFDRARNKYVWCDKLLEPNNVTSDVLRDALVRWFRIMLHVNGNERGGKRNSQGQLEGFTLAHRITSLKWLKLFRVKANTVSVVSYSGAEDAAEPQWEGAVDGAPSAGAEVLVLDRHGRSVQIGGGIPGHLMKPLRVSDEKLRADSMLYIYDGLDGRVGDGHFVPQMSSYLAELIKSTTTHDATKHSIKLMIVHWQHAIHYLKQMSLHYEYNVTALTSLLKHIICKRQRINSIRQQVIIRYHQLFTLNEVLGNRAIAQAIMRARYDHEHALHVAQIIPTLDDICSSYSSVVNIGDGESASTAGVTDNQLIAWHRTLWTLQLEINNKHIFQQLVDSGVTHLDVCKQKYKEQRHSFSMDSSTDERSDSKCSHDINTLVHLLDECGKVYSEHVTGKLRERIGEHRRWHEEAVSRERSLEALCVAVRRVHDAVREWVLPPLPPPAQQSPTTCGDASAGGEPSPTLGNIRRLCEGLRQMGGVVRGGPGQSMPVRPPHITTTTATTAQPMSLQHVHSQNMRHRSRMRDLIEGITKRK